MANGTESVFSILKMAILNKKEIWKIVMDNIFIMILKDKLLPNVNTKMESLLKEKMFITILVNLIL
jgi:hypothetical protein